MEKNKSIVIISIFLILAGIAIFLFFGSGRQEVVTLQNEAPTAVEDEKGEPQASPIGGENPAPQKNNEPEMKENIPPGSSVQKEEAAGASIVKRLVNFGFQAASGRSIDTIIIHSSYDALGNDPYDVSGLIAEYKAYGVAPHYLIDRKGTTYQLVEDKNIAYHAGEAKTPDGRSGVNNFSIGIEMMNTKEDKYAGEQYEALNVLISTLKVLYKIKYVLGHDQIAPGRKDDPWNFDWSKVKK